MTDGATLRIAAPIAGAERAADQRQHEALGQRAAGRCAGVRRRAPSGPPARASARVARASSRLATLAQQIRSTNPTTPRNSIEVSRRSLPTIESCSGSSVTPRPLLVCGNSRARPSATAAEIGFGRVDRHARLQPADDLQHVGGARTWRQVDDRPHRPDAALPHQLEILRDDADHRPRAIRRAGSRGRRRRDRR